MQRTIEVIHLYLAVIRYSIKTFFTYRVQAWLWMVQSVLSLIFTLVPITVIYSVSSGIPGWSYYQMLFLAYLASLTFGIALFLTNPWRIPWALRTGQFDGNMTKPFGMLTIIFVTFGCSVSSLFSGVMGSIVFLVYAAIKLNLSLAFFAAFIPLYLLGVAAFVLFLQTLGMLSYVLIRSGTFINRAMNVLTTLSRYPLSAYGIVAQLFFTLLVPVGIATYYPAQVLLWSTTPIYYAAFTALAVISIVAFYKLFNFMIRSYESGGG